MNEKEEIVNNSVIFFLILRIIIKKIAGRVISRAESAIAFSITILIDYKYKNRK